MTHHTLSSEPLDKGFDPPAKPFTVYWATTTNGQSLEWPTGMRVVSYGEYLEAISMLNKVLAYFHPTHELPEAANVYCEGFKMCHGYFPPAYKGKAK